MARAGMTGWRGRHAAVTEGGDDVQKSLELLDQVLSEFDDLENGNVGGTGASGATVVEVDSPSLGHQSEDDGYMSMNGRRAKFLLDLPPAPEPAGPLPSEMADFPPPPEEAERLIANLLPRVSPQGIGSPGHPRNRGKPIMSAACLGQDLLQNGDAIATATQTTLPKTRHQRPYGWQDDDVHPPAPVYSQGQFKYGSLPYEGMHQNVRCPPPWAHRSGPLPPRTLAGAFDRHREVRRQRTADDACSTPPPPPPVEDEAGFSDDSLEGSEQVEVINEPQRAQVIEAEKVVLSPGHRGSIAWEVPLDDALMAPGSTKVVGRRRRHSNERSSNGSLNRSKDGDDWPEPPGSTEDETASAHSDQDPGLMSAALPLDLTFNGTYVIRKGRKRERAPVMKGTPLRQGSLDTQKDYRTSATFDNIKQLLKEGRIEGLNDPPPDFQPPKPPALVRVLSLPNLPSDEIDCNEVAEMTHHRSSRSGDRFSNELSTTVEEPEDELSSLDNPSLNYVNLLPICYDEKPLPKPPPGCGDDDSEQISEKESANYTQGSAHKAVEVETQTDLSDIETQTELELVGKQIREISKTKSELEEVEKKIQEIVKIKTTLEREREKDLSGDPWVRASDLPPTDFSVQVEVHEFGPLPPSPVDEFDTYSELFHPGSQPMRRKADTLPEPFYRCDMGSDPGGQFLHRPPEPPPHRPDPVSGSLKSRGPEPISNSLKTRSMDAGFARGPKAYCNGSRRENSGERRTLPCELPGPASRRRTLQKRPSTSPQEGAQTSCSLPETPIFARGCDIPRTPARSTAGSGTGSYRPSPVGIPLAGVEVLRLTGGPARGWYPRHRQPRPASSEHLDRLPLPAAWDTARKPMTLPPNITPKFFHRSPRDALRRVTSLLIRGKGSSSKDGKKEMMTSTMPLGEHTDTTRQKRGFFRSWWKRSRHYSLDQQ